MSNIQYTSTYLLDSIHVSGSGISGLNSTGSMTPQYFFGTRNKLSFIQGAEYSLRTNLFCTKTFSNLNAVLEVYLVGLAFPSRSTYGVKIATYICPAENNIVQFPEEIINFVALETGTAHIRFVVYSGDWYASDVKVVSAKEIGFNPNDVSVILPVVGHRFEQLQFKTELYDANNTLVPILVESPKISFDGGNQILRGTDNRLYGTLTLVPSGSGPVLGVDASGSYVGITDVSVQQLPRPIIPANVASYVGPSIVTMYSGSTPFSASNVGPALGFQIIGHSAASGTTYLDFNTNTGVLSILADIQFIPGSAISQSLANNTSGSGATALAQLARLVNGLSSVDYPTATFLKNNIIFSPQIAGLTGYISQSFGVGNITSGSGIVLSALGYNSGSTYFSNSPTIYIGGITGSFASSSTPFFVASGSGGPLFSLGDRLYAQYIAGALNMVISGSNFNLNVASSNQTSSLSFGSATSPVSGSGMWLDQFGNFRAGQDVASTKYIRYDASTNIFTINFPSITSGTITNAFISNTNPLSNFSGSSAAARDITAHRSLAIGGNGSVGSASVFPTTSSLRIYSGSTLGTVLEVGSYSRVAGTNITTTYNRTFTDAVTGSIPNYIIGNSPFSIFLQSNDVALDLTGQSVLSNVISISGRTRIVEIKNISPQYTCYVTASVSASWTANWNDSASSNVTVMDQEASLIEVASTTILPYSYTFPVPSGRTGNTLTIRVITKIASS